ncbi:MAG: hypothetical protein GX442_21070 [Candidatus Riflebacteria bacterium]|nr:hypothetical protein [Candidatus Riflebacteria bacterium]
MAADPLHPTEPSPTPTFLGLSWRRQMRSQPGMSAEDERCWRFRWDFRRYFFMTVSAGTALLCLPPDDLLSVAAIFVCLVLHYLVSWL